MNCLFLEEITFYQHVTEFIDDGAVVSKVRLLCEDYLLVIEEQPTDSIDGLLGLLSNQAPAII